MNSIENRAHLQYTNQSSKYQSNISKYSHQYFNIYVKRLERIRPVLLEKIHLKWHDKYPVVNLSDLRKSTYNSCIIIGTIFKNQKLKPSILKEIADAEQSTPQPTITANNILADDSDSIHIEDEKHRFQLTGNITPRELVTGVTIAVLGTKINSGIFKVKDLIFPSFRSQINRPLFNNEDLYIILISGLDIEHSLDSILPFKLLIQWISGGLGDLNGINASKLTRIIIAGNSISNHGNDKQLLETSVDKQLDDLQSFDKLLLNAVQIIDVDLMPGEYDPTNYLLPQHPIHHCLFPQCAKYRSLNLVSNPYEFSIGNNSDGEKLRLLGTSGSPVKDVIKYSGGFKTAVQVMDRCLTWGHIAPTAPDTLSCYPFYDLDPFVLEGTPHVFFAGNQQRFETSFINDVRLIAIPEFCKSKEVCLLNLTSLDCCTICFDVSL